MPQLDLISFFPQIFWCFILFFSFFFYFSFAIIPQIATILKFRKKKLILLAHDINQKKDGSSSLLIEYDTVLKNSLHEISHIFKKLLHFGQVWVPSTMLQLNTTAFQSTNQRFLRSTFFKDLNRNLNK